MDLQYNSEVVIDHLASRLAELEKENAILKAILQFQQRDEAVGEIASPDS